MKITVDVISNKHRFEDLKCGDIFIFEPNRVRLYTKLPHPILFNHNGKPVNTVDHEGNGYYFQCYQECKKVEVEIKVIVKE